MSEDTMSEEMGKSYRTYHEPPETPREEMWAVIATRIRTEDVTGTAIDDLAEARRRRTGWSGARGWAAAAAVLVIGVALGRATAPGGPGAGAESAVGGAVAGERPRPTAAALDLAARDHLGRSESLLTMVRADARTGRLDPAVAPWARSLLAQTRLLLDARGDADPELDPLLSELELVLMQIVGVTEAAGDESRMRTELDLAVGGMNDREVLTRIRAVLPAGMAGA
jgi:hypothetical protein